MTCWCTSRDDRRRNPVSRRNRVSGGMIAMSRHALVLSLLAGAAAATSLAVGLPAADPKPEPRQRGRVKAEVARPDSFPHRIWAACDFEGRTRDYAWFGPAERKNIPAYPGNLTALGVGERP